MSTSEAKISTEGVTHTDSTTLVGRESGRDEPLDTPWTELAKRLHKAERQSRWLKFVLLLMAPLLVYVFIGQELPDRIVQRQSVVASDRVQLFDESGNTRLYMRVYSGVPVVQLIGENGKPRLSLGLRYDDSPFISLADDAGQTRATLQLGEDNAPALNLFDENGEPSFSAR
jgi:hypothetical protein